MRTRIEVTATDIRLGVFGSACKCPVARAVKRALHTRHVYVRENGVMEIRGIRIKTPTRIGSWIDSFDAGNRMSPTTFNLNLP